MLSEVEYKRQLREWFAKNYAVGDIVECGGEEHAVVEVDPSGRLLLADVGWWPLDCMGLLLKRRSGA